MIENMTEIINENGIAIVIVFRIVNGTKTIIIIENRFAFSNVFRIVNSGVTTVQLQL